MAYKIQFKHPSGWMSVEADTYDNFFADLAVIFGQDRTEQLIGSIADQSSEGGAAPAAPAPQAPAAPQPGLGSASWGAPPAPPSAPPAPPAAPAAPATPAAATPAWDANPPHCPHGQRRSRAWTPQSGRNAGKEQFTFFCPLPQDRKAEQCQPIDAVTGKEWGSR